MIRFVLRTKSQEKILNQMESQRVVDVFQVINSSGRISKCVFTSIKDIENNKDEYMEWFLFNFGNNSDIDPNLINAFVEDFMKT